MCLLGPPVQHSLLVDFPALACTLLWAISSPVPTSSIATMVFQLHWLWAICILQTFKSHRESVLALSPRVLVRESPSQGECCHIFKLFLIQFYGLYPILVQHSRNLGLYTLSQLLLVHAGSVLQFLWVIVPFFLYQAWHFPSWNMLWFHPIFFWWLKGGQIGVSCVSSQGKGLCIVFKWGGNTSLSRGVVGYCRRPRKFRAIWRLKIFKYVNPDVLLPHLRVPFLSNRAQHR